MPRLQQTTIFFAAIAAVIFVSTPMNVGAQDGPGYIMYETIYVSVAHGHADMMTKSMSAHNKRFHHDNPYAAYVFSIVSGPRTGDLMWVMGPTTYTDLDSRPSGEPHDSDWDTNVLKHSDDVYNGEYWVRTDELSYMPPSDDDARPVSLVRFFEVADVAMFFKVQRQITAVFEAKDRGAPRVMYKNRSLNRDKRDWAVVSSFKSWSELDDAHAVSDTDFEADFKSIHGEEAWEPFVADFDVAVTSREDEWRVLMPEMSATPGEDD